jgi:sRNA-binding protein
MPHIKENPATGDDGASVGCSGKNELTVNNQTKPPPQGSWKGSAIEPLDKIRVRFPYCFAGSKERTRNPLKIGIHLDIAAGMPELPEADISRALKFYVTRFRYLECCLDGAPRLDLNGEPAGVVSAAEAASAQRWLSKRRKGRPQSAPSLASPPQRLTLAALKEAAKRKLEMRGA